MSRSPRPADALSNAADPSWQLAAAAEFERERSRLPRRPASTRTSWFRPESKSPGPEGELSYEGSRCSLDSRCGVPGLVDPIFTSSAVSSASAAESWID
jgi:hypothetical protein